MNRTAKPSATSDSIDTTPPTEKQKSLKASHEQQESDPTKNGQVRTLMERYDSWLIGWEQMPDVGLEKLD